MIKETSFGIIPLQKRDNKWYVFLIRHKNGEHWGFPKGRQKDGESPQQTAVRELREETNLKIIFLLQETSLKEHYHCVKEGKQIDKTAQYYIAMVEGSVLLQENEVLEGEFVLLEEAEKMITYKESQELCKKVKKIVETL